MARLVLLISVVILAGCRADLGAHLPATTESFSEASASTAGTALRMGREDISELTSFPDMVDATSTSISSGLVTFDTLQERGRVFGTVYDDGHCLPGEPGYSTDVSRFFEVRRGRR